MKKPLLIISLILSILTITIYPNMVCGEQTTIDTSSFVHESQTESTNASESISSQENLSSNSNQEQIGQNRNVSGITENLSSTPVSSKQSNTSSENTSGLSATMNDTDTSTEDIIINSLPKMPPSEEPDTLSKIINWWSVNPLEMKLWYLFLFLSGLLFLFRQTSFRKPLLFASLVIFGFYFSNTINPINSIFSIPIQTGTKLLDSIVLVLLPIVLSLIFGRFFCGWACPIGAVQEFLHPEKYTFQLPPILDRILSYFRFILLVGGVVFSWSALTNIWSNIDPFYGFFSFKWSLPIAVLLFVVIIASLFIERFFCRYFCPLGALLTITSKFSLFKVRADSEVCIACGKCSQPKACPMNAVSVINPYTDLPSINASKCIVCYRCADVCRYSALKLLFSSFRKNNRFKNKNSETLSS